MSKRLEDIKEAIEVLRDYQNGAWILPKVLFKSLDVVIERVKYLEQTTKNLWAENRYKVELENENKRYREALEFYADENNWKEKSADEGDCMTDFKSIVCLDSGYQARKALESEPHA